jgi:serine/threonine-protein kinase HipA
MTATTHIFKPQIGKLENGIDLSQSVENEHFCMTFMAALGMPVAKTTIQDFGEKRVLIVERFDRQWATDGRLLRRPQEDCCQALSVPPTMKYEPDGGPGIRQILELLKGSDDPANDQKMFLKAQLSFWLLGATDGHAKNFSVFLNPGGRFHLTPLYDIMSTQPNVDAGQINRNKMKLAMAVGDNRHYVIDKILPRHFIQTVVLSNLPAEKVTGVIEELEHEVLLALDKTKDQMPADFPEAISSSINIGIKSRLQLFQIP